MNTRQTIIIALLAFLWIDVLGRLAILVAAFYQIDGTLPSFDSLDLRFWPMILLYFGGLIVITIVGLIYAFTEYDIPERHSDLVKKIGPIFIIIFFITICVAFIPGSFLTGQQSLSNLFLMALFFALGICFWYPYFIALAKPCSQEQADDSQTKKLVIRLPYDKAFAAGKEIIYAIDAEDITTNLIVDPVQGTIFVEAVPGIQSLMAKRPSHITLSFQENAYGTTNVTISAVTPGQAAQWGRPTGLNEQYVVRIANFLLVKSGKQPVLPEPVSQEVYRNSS
jgi:hypothetical protein